MGDWLLVCCVYTAEAESTYGKEKLKIYRSAFTPMYHAVTSRKTKMAMKLITVLPEQKVSVPKCLGNLLVTSPFRWWVST